MSFFVLHCVAVIQAFVVPWLLRIVIVLIVTKIVTSIPRLAISNCGLCFYLELLDTQDVMHFPFLFAFGLSHCL